MKTPILALIREDIKQTRFIQQLNEIGLCADEHLLDLPQIILNLMEIKMPDMLSQDAIQMGYMNLICEACGFMNDPEELDRRVEMIYSFLKELQTER